MNEFTHFLTGFLVARYILKKKHTQFESFFCAVAAFILDFDYLVQSLIPSFEHGVITHTILGALLCALLFSVITWYSLQSIMKEIQLSFRHLLLIAFAGVLSHLFLDSFTFYEGAYDAIHHVYFWPIWDFPVHINTMFPQATYDLRVWLEVGYTVVIVAVWMVYGWLIKKENPFGMLRTSQWWPNYKDPIPQSVQKISRIYLGSICVLFVLYTLVNLI